MAEKVEDKGEKVEDKGEKVEDKGGLGGLLGPAGGLSGSGGLVVVSFIGQAGLDVRRLAGTILFGGRRGPTRSLTTAAAEAVKRSRKREEDQEKRLKNLERSVSGLTNKSRKARINKT